MNIKNNKWSFKSKKIAHGFDKHIQMSIPQYKERSNLIAELSSYVLESDSIIYDLGTSTGYVLGLIKNKNKDKKLRLIGVDESEEMIQYAGNHNKGIEFIFGNIEKLSLEKNDMTIINFTLQFIKYERRLSILKKTYKSLYKGGILIFSEKENEDSSEINKIISDLYEEFKLSNNFTPRQVFEKKLSLKGIMKICKPKENAKLLQLAGFKKVSILYKSMNFVTYIAIK